VGITVAVGVVVGFVTGAGVTSGRILALGVDLFPAIAAAVTLLGVDTTGVGLILAVGGSDVLAIPLSPEAGVVFNVICLCCSGTYKKKTGLFCLPYKSSLNNAIKIFYFY